ncbi:MAG: protein FdrA, partial [Acidimicrobiia bacterium]|nr:protein FdrA [Acidimicrobiia bacterium]
TSNAIADVITSLPPTRRRLVGLFSGGTLCYEAMAIASTHIGAIHSNTPLDETWTIPAPDGAHVCLDLGEEEYTAGRPHPMIDPEARIERMVGQIDDPTVAVVLLDVVLGDAAHENPAGLLAPVAARIVDAGAAVVAYVLGTERDPQGFEAQRDMLRQAGCIVTETAARAALAAAAIVNRDPALVHDDLSG